MDAPGRRIDVGGRNLHCRLLGSGAPTVVIESGGGGGASVQDWPLQKRVAALARCLTYDRAGLGWSDPPTSPRTFSDMAADLDALLEALGEEPPYVFAGGSFGGLVLQAYARLFPDKVAGMVLIDACDPEKYFGTMRRMRGFHERELRSAIAAAGAGELRHEAAPRIEASALKSEERAAALHVMGSASHFEAALAELQVLDGGMPPAPSRTPLLGDAPLIVLSHGRPYEGDLAPWEEGWGGAQDRLARLSSRSAHIVASRCGHGIASEHPKLVAAAIAAVAAAARGTAFDHSEVLSLAE